jgi:hypothetical protein
MDIVERLRLINRAYLFCQWFHPDKEKKVIPVGDIMNDAADEIERLREALAQIANFDLYSDYSNAYNMPAIARAALKEGE